MKIIIIGGIAAGMSAAAKLRRTDKEAQIVVYEKGEYVSFGACGLPYYVGDFFDNHERMLVRTPEQIVGMGIELHLRHEVISVNSDDNVIEVYDHNSNRTFKDHYDRLMIATGASPLIPPLKGLELKDIYMLRTLEDGIQVKKAIKSPDVKKVGIIGAGFIGLEIVEAAKNLGKEVAVFQLEDRILKDTFDAEVTSILEDELREEGVQLHLNTKVVGFEGSEKVEKIITTDSAYDVDLVIIATGVRPNTEFLKDTGIERLKNGAIIIDKEGRTSIENIYAAGDCATVPHRLKEEPSYIPLATNANKIGRIVGENLAGKNLKFDGTLGSSCIKILNMEAGRTGFTEEEAKRLGLNISTVFITDKNHTDYYPGQEKICVKLIYDANTKVILGGQVVGKSDAVQRTNVLATAITAKMTTEQLGMLDLCYAPPFSRTWDVLNIAGNAAK